MLLRLLLLALLALARAQTLCGVANEEESLTFNAPLGYVVGPAIFAAFGTPTGDCPTFTNGTCVSGQSVSIVNSLCNGQPSCVVNASDTVFGDPCPYVTKNLRVLLDYHPNDSYCSETYDPVHILTMIAPLGYYWASVRFANYGTPNGYCGSYVANATCQSASAFSIIQSYCVGLTACRVHSYVSLFGDPCPGVLKHLFVELQFADINECQTNNGGCSQNPMVNCTNTPGSFTCGSCPAGYTGNGKTCTDIDECLTNNGNCGTLLCVNTIPSYACLPCLVSGSVEIISGATLSNNVIVLSNTLGGQVLAFQVMPGTFSSAALVQNTQVLYGPPPDSTYLTCQNVAWTPSGSLYDVSCTLKPGGGKGYYFSLLSSWNNTLQYTRDYNTSFDYPNPTITPFTLSSPPNPPLAGNGAAYLTAPNSLGQEVMFLGTNFVSDLILMSVTFGPPSNPYAFTCSLTLALTNSTTITCITQAGGYGQGLIFAVSTYGSNTTGIDVYNYQQMPNITSLQGCNMTQGAGIAGCPTSGGVTITLYGSGFLPPIAILVDSYICPLITLISSSQMTCLLPHGIGLVQTIRITSTDQFSTSYPLISYAPPLVNMISANLCINDFAISLSNCPRMGGVWLTLQGENFGETGGTVLIGVEECQNLTHSIQTPDELMTCLLPSGNILSAPLVFLQGGQFSSSKAVISYAQCPPGTYQLSLGCLPCELGTFSLLYGQTACQDCPVGAYTPTTGSTNCTICEPGQYANVTGLSNCLNCSVGSYATNQGSILCLSCPKGTAVDIPGASVCSECTSGYFQAKEGQAMCSLCPMGQALNALGQAACLSCDVGRFSNQNGSDVCIACPAGLFQNQTGQTDCFECSPGYYSSVIGQVSCIPCSPGSYSSEYNSSMCLPCNPGLFTEKYGETVCTNCSEGTYLIVSGQKGCLLCPPGKFTNTSGQITCSPCAPGFAQNAAESSSCQNCAAGYYAPGGSSSCTRCSAGYVAPFNNLSSCLLCPNEAISSDDFTTCLCPVGTYSEVENSSNGIGDCLSCPLGAACDIRGHTKSDLQTSPGWWRPSNSSVLEFYLCLHPSRCLGGMESDCGGNFVGPLCSVCKPGYGASSTGPNCQRCPSKGASIFLSIFLILVVLLGLILLFYLAIRSDSLREQAKTGREDTDAPFHIRGWFQEREFLSGEPFDVAFEGIQGRGFTTESRSPKNLMFTMKIALSFAQIITNLSFIPTIPWPPTYQAVVSSFTFLNMNFIPWQSVECVTKLDYYHRLLLLTITPPAVLLCFCLLFLIPMYFQDRNDFTDSNALRLNRARRRQQFTKIVLFTLFLTYPSISSTVLSYWVCRSVGTTSYLVVDFSLQCYDAQWFRYLGLAIVMLIIYPVGVPASFFLILYRNRNRLIWGPTKRLIGFLYEAYYVQIWWFELVDMLHKLFLTSLVPFFPVNQQIPAAMIAIVLYLMVLLVTQPYIRSGNDIFHMLIQVALFLILLSANVIAHATDSRIDPSSDVVLSFFLLTILVFLVFFCLREGLESVRRVVREYQRSKLTRVANRAQELSKDKTSQEGPSTDEGDSGTSP